MFQHLHRNTNRSVSRIWEQVGDIVSTSREDSQVKDKATLPELKAADEGGA